MESDIIVLPGDGVGPEVVQGGLRVLDAVAESYGHAFHVQEDLIGGSSVDRFGVPLRKETVSLCKRSDAVLLGAVGGPKWDGIEADRRPERGLLQLRKELGLYANLRPVKVLPMLAHASQLRPETLQGVDLVFVRELTGGIYFGQPSNQWKSSGVRKSVDTLEYSETEIERIVRVAFELARTRRRKVTSVDKANVLQSSKLWRQVAQEVARGYSDIALEHMLVDTCAMSLVQSPKQFDVLVTENMFGDILTDEASALAGSIGMLPSASLAGVPGQRALGVYEPIHGSAPTLAGRDAANPIGTILSAAMLLRYSLGLQNEARAMEEAVYRVLEQGYRTQDISSATARKVVGTQEMSILIATEVREGTSSAFSGGT
jgi:3-isopropylmalate dehydrogenase